MKTLLSSMTLYMPNGHSACEFIIPISIWKRRWWEFALCCPEIIWYKGPSYLLIFYLLIHLETQMRDVYT